VIADISHEGAEEAAASLKQQGGRAVAVAVNVADPASVSAMVASVLDAFGRIEILINNAGIGGNSRSLRSALKSGTGSSPSI
jgi:NAD(P)-dependent dehydrogenase (short-subunit alcohol dehydrogenase family)